MVQQELAKVSVFAIYDLEDPDIAISLNIDHYAVTTMRVFTVFALELHCATSDVKVTQRLGGE